MWTLLHADKFEQLVLKSDEQDIDWSMFINPDDKEDDLTSIKHMPLHIYNWSQNSRRVYHLNQDLQLFLEATELGDTEWKDVIFPFDSFYISLEVPIKDNDGTACYDGILVSKYLANHPEGTFKTLELQLLTNEFANRPLLSKKDRELLTKTFRRNDVIQFSQILTKLYKRITFHSTCAVLYPELFKDVPISTAVGELWRQYVPRHDSLTVDDESVFFRSDWQDAAKIVLGFCLYLENIHSSKASMQFTPAKNPGTTLDQHSITNTAQFYDVRLDYNILSNEEKEYLNTDPQIRKAYREMGFHWRRAHKRFPRGTKHLPNAQKTEKVKACRVRADRQPPNSLTAGAKHNL